jgi:hypothetical protein
LLDSGSSSSFVSTTLATQNWQVEAFTSTTYHPSC